MCAKFKSIEVIIQCCGSLIFINALVLLQHASYSYIPFTSRIRELGPRDSAISENVSVEHSRNVAKKSHTIPITYIFYKNSLYIYIINIYI